MRRSRTEVLLAIELVALTSFAFARPVLGTFGETPAMFLGRDASRLDIVAFALVVTVVPALVVVAVGAATTVFGPRVRHATHLALVAVCAGVGAWRAVNDPTGGRAWALPGLAAGLACGVAVGLLRWRARTGAITAGFLRWAGIGAVVFLVQFLWLSPVGGQLLQPAAAVDPEATAAATAPLDDGAPPVVVVVLDELPTMTLLDGRGAIDGELFPNLAALAGDATWYRNHTTVAGHTTVAVPALATGRYPPADVGTTRPDPRNIFSLLGGHYDMAVRESVTRLCPDDLCPSAMPSALGPLLGDAARWWRIGATWEALGRTPTLPGATGPDRYELARRFVADLDFSGGARPAFTFLHVLVPHSPWQFTDEGELYDRPPMVPGVFGTSWTDAGIDVARQRHVLQAQAADALVGDVLAQLRAAGAYDDALVVVTADHGVSFMPSAPARGMVEGNEHEILWTPLLVKEPGQTDGAVDDANVLSIDLVPTIADALGIDVPWPVDGIPARRAAEVRPPHVKPFVSGYDGAGGPAAGNDAAPLEIDTEAMFRRVLAADAVPATGPDAAWRLTAYGAVIGDRVDDHAAGDPVDGTVTLTWPSGFDGIDLDAPLPLEVVAGTDLPVGTVVAFALDGTIAATGAVQDHPEGDGRLVQGLLVPWAFHDGDHELEAFAVTGDPAAPVLAPVDVGW